MRLGLSSIGRTRITTSQIFALSAGVLMLAGASHFAQQTFQKITQNGSIRVNIEEFSWWKKSEFKLAEVDEVELSSAQHRIESEVEKSQIKISTPHALLAKPKKDKIAKRVKKSLPVVISAPVVIPTAPATESVAESVTESVFDSSLTSLPTPAEILGMQNVYRAMRGNFEVATQLRPALDTQPSVIATRDLDQVPVELSADEEEFLAVYEKSAVIVDEAIEPPAPEQTPTEKEQVAAVVVSNPKEILKSNIQSNTVVSENFIEDIAKTAPVVEKSAVAIQTTGIDEVPEAAFEIAEKETPKSQPIIEAPIQTQQSAAVRVEPKKPTDTSSEDLRTYTEDLVTALDSHVDPENEYPKGPGPKAAVTTHPATSKRSAFKVDGQRVADQPKEIAMADISASTVKGVKQDPNGVTISWNENESLDAAESLIDSDIGSSFQIGKAGKKVGIASNQANTEKLIPDPKRFCDSALIGKEALLISSNQEMMSVCRRSISFEGVRSEQSRWWEVRESTSHWPTLIWQKEADAFLENSRIPMLSFNTVKLLSAISRTEAQMSAGIVFGEVPAGLEMSLSGRADAPTFFDRNMKPIASSDVSQARYFAFLNVAPGNPLLYVSSRGGIQSAAISILVQAGHGTYVNVPSPKLVKIKTTVYDAGSSRPRGLSSLSVQVIGQEGKAAVTNTLGQFEISDVVVFGDYPLYLDVAPNEQSFKHRYRLSPTEVSSKNLFYFNEQTVAHWISQLEGGVSPVSGLIVGAVSSLAKEKNAKLLIGSLEKKTSLAPEVYGLSGSDELIADPKLGQNQIRFIGVQVSEGANIPSVFNSAGEMIWSELVIAQPGVINVVGP